MASPLHIISLLLAVLLGFTFHRASLCTVRAVAEVMSTRRAHMALAMLKTVLWVFAVVVPVVLLSPDSAAPFRSYPVSVAAVGGGFVFGLGAAVNNGCAFSTLWHLASGNLWMLTTIGGYCLGVAVLTSVVLPVEPIQTVTPFFLNASKPMAWILLSILWAYMCREAFHLWRTGIRGRRWQSLFLEKQYRLSTAAIILGVSGGVLYASHEAWTYTNLMKQAILSFHPSVGGPGRIDMVPVIFLFGGMLISGWQSGKWRLRLRGNHSWFRHFLGGVLMGAGAVLIPGGNDTLLFKGLPGFSPHAAPALAAIFVGIGTGLLLVGWFADKKLIVDCREDRCRAYASFWKMKGGRSDQKVDNNR